MQAAQQCKTSSKGREMEDVNLCFWLYIHWGGTWVVAVVEKMAGDLARLKATTATTWQALLLLLLAAPRASWRSEHQQKDFPDTGCSMNSAHISCFCKFFEKSHNLTATRTLNPCRGRFVEAVVSRNVTTGQRCIMRRGRWRLLLLHYSSTRSR